MATASVDVLSDREIQLINRLSLGTAIVSTIICTFILIAILWVWSRKHARPILDRVSFRLFWWTMGFELFYDIGYIVGESYTGSHYTPAACSASIYLLMMTMGVVNYLCTCIAINLMLIICFRVNPSKWRLERWYVGVSIGLGVFIPIIPTALGHFGHDPILDVCWVSADNDTQRMLYLVVDLYLWQLLSCVIASVAVAMTIYSIFRLRRASSKAMFLSNTLNQSQNHADSAGGKLGQHDDQFLKTALRISTYPVALIIVNGIISGVDLYISAVGGVHNEVAYAFYVIYYFLYGGRGIFFALLGLFVDPCLRKGMRAAWRKDPGPIRPPFSELPTTTELEPKGSDINSSILPMISYDGGGPLRRESAIQLEVKAYAEPLSPRAAARRESEVEIVAAMAYNTSGDVEAAPGPSPGNVRRGSRKGEVDDSVL